MATLTGDEAIVAMSDAGDYAITSELNTFWLFFGAVIVFFMQCGFAFLEAGTLRAKNTKNILLKNVLDACLSGIIWWAWGHSFAFGEGGMQPNQFIGGHHFFLDSRSKTPYGGGDFSFWFFEWAFAAAAATIVSGAVAERCRLQAYAVYTIFITGFIYPVVVHWGWSGEGWLSAFNTLPVEGSEGDYEYNPLLANGLIDFAGSGIVHMVGGGAALMGAIFLGPRTGRFAEGVCVDMPASNVGYQVLGGLILWVGWYGFNPVSTLCLVGCMDVAARVAVNTTISAAAGGLSTLGVTMAMGAVPEPANVINGILAGLVAITCPCPVVEPYGAFVIGLIAGPVLVAASALLKKLQIDDPLDASPIHFFCGMWGVISAGLFATETLTTSLYGGDSQSWGGFYGGGGKQLGVQVIAVLAIAAWTCGLSGLMFAGLKAAGMLRVPLEEEEKGLDESHHGGAAFDMGKAMAAVA